MSKRTPRSDAADLLFNQEALTSAKELPGYKGREMFFRITPEEFLSVSEKISSPELSAKKKDAIKAAIKSGQPLRDIPFLKIDETGRVVGHEGRHRALVLQEMGYGDMPATLTSSRTRFSEQVDPSRFDYLEDLPRTIKAQAGAADEAASIAVPYETSGPRRGLLKSLAPKALATGVAAKLMLGGAAKAAGLPGVGEVIEVAGREDPSLQQFFRDESLFSEENITGALGLPQRSQMPVYSMDPARESAARVMLRTGRKNLRPAFDEPAITEQEIKYVKDKQAKRPSRNP